MENKNRKNLRQQNFNVHSVKCIKQTYPLGILWVVWGYFAFMKGISEITRKAVKGKITQTTQEYARGKFVLFRF